VLQDKQAYEINGSTQKEIQGIVLWSHYAVYVPVNSISTVRKSRAIRKAV